ncbi:hypothetical protein CCHR01_05860 [Colletotrichum chrysophilum]|uniref:Uncharacterized protein n=1 Tax=Colletotrichum chrysophilum TaxID=1836956 RepID=A0AAD9EL41_9PEZI|nr:hypothetical protein CCHR01_05860 [Colletotrichum chrysophilum]
MKHFPTSMTWKRAENCLKSTATTHHIHAAGILTPALTSSKTRHGVDGDKRHRTPKAAKEADNDYSIDSHDHRGK